MRAAAIAFIATVLMTACGSRSETGFTASATVSPASTTSATPPATAGPVAFPLDLPFIVGTNAGDLFFQLTAEGSPTGRSVHACSDPVRNIVTNGRRAIFFCGTGAASTLYLYDDATAKISSLAKTEALGGIASFTELDQVVYVDTGQVVPTAPIPMTRLVLKDLKSGATTTIDERFGVAFSLQLTGEGVAVWRPRNSLSFARPDAEAGTWVMKGTSLTKYSPLRLIEGGNARDLLEPEGTDGYGYSSSSNANTHVVLRTATDQIRLTPMDVSNEKAVALLDDGRVVAWRPTVSGYEGVVVVYDPVTRAVVRTDRGKFSPTGVLRTGGWLIGLAYLGGPPGILGYRISDGAFASMAGGSISAFAFLGAK